MMGMPILELEGYEADDVIGTLAVQASSTGIDVYIVSGDLDGSWWTTTSACSRPGWGSPTRSSTTGRASRALRPPAGPDARLQGAQGRHLGQPARRARRGREDAVALLQEFGTLDALYERLDEVKGKLRERLATHRDDAFTSREVGRIVTDLPISLDLESARTATTTGERWPSDSASSSSGRSSTAYRRRSAAQPTSARTRTMGALQLSLDLLGGARVLRRGARAAGVVPPEGAVGLPDARSDPKGAIEHIDPRIVTDDADRLELEAWLAAHGGCRRRMGGGHRRSATRSILGIALAGADGTAWYLRAGGDDRLPRWFTRTDRPLIGHDLKPLHTMLLQRGVELSGADRDTLVASYMLNPALRAQSIDDLAAQRFGAELPPPAVTPESGSEEPAVARRAAGVALTALLVAPTLMTELREVKLADLFEEVEMPLLPVLARMEMAGVLIDRDALRAMSDEFAAQLAGLETRIFESVGHEFNIGSPRQLETVLFDELELPSTKRTKTARSTDASVLEELRDRHDVVGMILEHRQVAKLKSTYADALPGLVDADGRLDLLPGGGRHRAAVEHRSESPEHPDPDRARAVGSGACSWPPGQAPARRGLLAGRAPDPGPRLGRRRPEGGVRGRRGHPSIDRSPGARHPART